jgi:hypothetical protein
MLLYILTWKLAFPIGENETNLPDRASKTSNMQNTAFILVNQLLRNESEIGKEAYD